MWVERPGWEWAGIIGEKRLGGETGEAGRGEARERKGRVRCGEERLGGELGSRGGEIL